MNDQRFGGTLPVSAHPRPAPSSGREACPPLQLAPKDRRRWLFLQSDAELQMGHIEAAERLAWQAVELREVSA